MRRPAYQLAMLSAFLILALVLTYPLVTRLATHVPGSNLWAFDEYTFVWNLWWFKHALLDLHQSPLSTNFIFYPVGVDLALYTFTLFNAALALPLLPWLPLPLVSNLVTLFAFVISAYGAYLLANAQLARADERKWVRELAAIAAGIAYAFTTSKFVYAAIGHYDLLGTEWLPFFVLYLLRSLRVGTTPISARRDAVLAGLFLALSLYVEMSFGVFLAVFTLIFLLVQRPWRWLEWSRIATALAVLGATALVLYLPVLLPVLNELLFASYTLKGWGDAQKLSVDLVGLFAPSALSPWAGLDWNQELTNVVQGKARFSDVHTLFLGYATLALALLGLAARWRAAKLWAAAALVFAVFALGPLLQINGVSQFDLDGLKVNVPLPFIILHYIPIVQANRVPNRFSVVLVLCMAMLVAYGVSFLLAKLGARALTLAAFVVIALLLIGDHLAVPLPLTDARVPAIYAQLGADQDDYTILQLPLGWRNSFGTLGAEDTRVQYYQSVHHKRLLNGNTSRNHPYKFQYFAQLPIISSLIALEEYKQVPPDQMAFDRAVADEFVRFFDLRYVVVNPVVPGRLPYADTREAALRYLLAVLPLDAVGESDGVMLYRVRRSGSLDDVVVDFGEPASRLYRGEGWGGEEEIAGARANWASERHARVLLPVDTPSARTLSFAAQPFSYPDAPPQNVTVVVNSALRLPPVALKPGWQIYELSVPASALHAGINELSFEFTYARAPREVLASDDARTLSAAFDWLRWQKQ